MAEPDEQQAREAQALFGLLGRLQGLDTLPLVDPHQDPVPLPDIRDAIDVLRGAQHVPAPYRLELLAQATRANRANTVPALTEADVDRFADSLVKPGLEGPTRDGTRGSLLELLADSKLRQDPLGRSTTQLAETGGVAEGLDPDIQRMALSFFPECDAKTTSVRGVPALSISTQSITTKPIAEFETIIDPFDWPKCWLESHFFKKMGLVQPPQPPPDPIPPRDHGWQAILLEVVDFGLGFTGTHQRMQTELQFLYFFPENPQLAGQFARGGCTYDRHRSVDGKITVDQGYLLVEDLSPTENARRFRTQKVVHFASGDPVPAKVCLFWSFVAGMIQQGC